MSDQKGTVVDFTDDPQKPSFGESVDADGGIISGSLGENAKNAALGNAPIYSQWNNAKTAWNNGLNPPQPYFHGEWWEELLNATQASADIALQIVDVFDYGKGVVNLFTGNFLDILGTLAAAVCKGWLDFLWNSFTPLQDAVGVLLGNPPKIQNSGNMWNSVSENLKALEEAMGPGLDKMLSECWEGQAACNASVRAADLLQTVDFASQSAKGLSELLLIYADMAARINDTVRQFIADIVGTVVGAIGDIATKGPLAIIPIGIDLGILLARYTARLIGIAVQELWFIIAGIQLLTTIKGCFDKAMEVLKKFSDYNPVISV
ncbi:hypothetical protein AB0K52_20500 [Glycomyces sp. NPDC049804]|uniref:hypothetical protein n=1 Tax=Glycomyces sp. NPDC049804 TaxID=3154363 RepID=UPI003449E190